MTRIGFANRRTLSIVALAVFVVGGILVVRKTVDGSDFFMHEVGRGIFNGEKVYPGGEFTEHITGPERLLYGKRDDRPYLYAPAPAIIASPLAFLPPLAAVAVWYVIKVALLVASVRLLISIFTRWQLPRPTALALLVATIPVFRFIENDFMNGQINVAILFLVILHIWAYVAGYRFLAGMTLAAALVIKQPSLLFVAYWAMRWQFRLLAGVGVGVLLWFYLLPGLFVGYPKIHDYNVQWFHSIIYSPEGDSLAQKSAESTDAQGESLLGFLAKYLSESDASHHRDEPVYLHIADLKPQTVSNIHAGLSMLFVLGLWALTLRKSPNPPVQNWRTFIELALVASLTLLLSPISHKAHYVLMLPTCLLAAYALVQLRPRSNFVLWMYAIASVLLVLRNDWTTERGAVPLSALMLIAATVYLHIRPPEIKTSPENTDVGEHIEMRAGIRS